MVPWPALVDQLLGSMALVIRLMRCCGIALDGPPLLTCSCPLPAPGPPVEPPAPPPCEANGEAPAEPGLPGDGNGVLPASAGAGAGVEDGLFCAHSSCFCMLYTSGMG